MIWKKKSGKIGKELDSAGNLERYQSMVEFSPDGIVIADAKTRQFVFANQAFCDLLGYKRAEILKMSVADIHRKEDLDYVLNDFREMVNGEKLYSKDLPCLKKNGEIVCVDIKSGFLDPQKKHIMGFFRDVSERREIGEDLEKADFYLNAMADGLLVLDLELNIVKINRALADMWGYSPEEMYGEKLSILFPEDEIPLHKLEMEAARKDNSTRSFESKAIRKDGGIFPVFIRGTLLKDDGGELIGYIGVFRDISEQKQSVQRIEDLSRFPSENPNPVLRIDAKGKILYKNNAVSRILGEEGFPRSDVARLLPKGINYLINDMLKSGKSLESEVELKDRTFLYHMHPLIEKDYVNIYGIDISEQKQASDEKDRYLKDLEAMRDRYRAKMNELQEKDQRLLDTSDKLEDALREWRATFDAISDFVLILDLNHTIRRANFRFAEALNIDPHELIGKKCYEVFHQSDQPWPGCPFEMTKKDNLSHTVEVADPIIGIPLEVTTSPLYDSRGKLAGGVHIARDMTGRIRKRKEMEKRIKMLEKKVVALGGKA